jgi:hypothetical protein
MVKTYYQWDEEYFDFSQGQFIVVCLPLYPIKGYNEYVVVQQGRGTVVDGQSFRHCLVNELKLRSGIESEVIRTADELNALKAIKSIEPVMEAV